MSKISYQQLLLAAQNSVTSLDSVTNTLNNTGNSAEITSLGAQITNAQNVISELTAKGESLQDQIDKEEGLLTAPPTRQPGESEAKYEKALKAWQTKNATALAQIASLTSELKGVLSALKSLQGSLTELEDKLKTLEKEAKNAQQKQAIDNLLNQTEEASEQAAQDAANLNKQIAQDTDVYDGTISSTSTSTSKTHHHGTGDDSNDNSNDNS